MWQGSFMPGVERFGLVGHGTYGLDWYGMVQLGKEHRVWFRTELCGVAWTG